jgi:hypothetical protein
MQTTSKNVKRESGAMNEIDLHVEELEEVIAPVGNPPPTIWNHNETLVSEEIELSVEELEEVIAPGPITTPGASWRP